MANEFWLSDTQWEAIDPLLRPIKNRPHREVSKNVILNRMTGNLEFSVLGTKHYLETRNTELDLPIVQTYALSTTRSSRYRR